MPSSAAPPLVQAASAEPSPITGPLALPGTLPSQSPKLARSLSQRGLRRLYQSLSPARIAHLLPQLRHLLIKLFIHLIPVFLWLILFSIGSKVVPPAYRPPINVTLLPHVDALLGGSMNWFANHDDSHPTLDVFAAVPYTIHAALPFLFIAATFLLAPVKNYHHLFRFVLAFGLMNLAAIMTHLMFPTSPPWYFHKFGTTPATYELTGDPAVLAGLDERFNMQMYHKMYGEASKIVFGAWPSLHAAWPYLMARFRPALPYRMVRMFQWAYVLLIWWAAMYLQHHYLADILGGVLYAEVAYVIAGFIILGRRGSKKGLDGFKRVPSRDSLLPVTVKR